MSEGPNCACQYVVPVLDQGIPHTHSASDMEAVCTTFDICRYDVVCDENKTYHHPNAVRIRIRVMPQLQVHAMVLGHFLGQSPTSPKNCEMIRSLLY